MGNGLKKSDLDWMAMANFVLSIVMNRVEIFVVHGYNQGNGIEQGPVPTEDESDNPEDDNSDESVVDLRLDDRDDDCDHEDYFEVEENLKEQGQNEEEQIIHVEAQFLANTTNPIQGDTKIPPIMDNDSAKISDGYETESLHSARNKLRQTLIQKSTFGRLADFSCYYIYMSIFWFISYYMIYIEIEVQHISRRKFWSDLKS